VKAHTFTAPDGSVKALVSEYAGVGTVPSDSIYVFDAENLSDPIANTANWLGRNMYGAASHGNYLYTAYYSRYDPTAGDSGGDVSGIVVKTEIDNYNAAPVASYEFAPTHDAVYRKSVKLMIHGDKVYVLNRPYGGAAHSGAALSYEAGDIWEFDLALNFLRKIEVGVAPYD
jgi:hypothetical protein